MSDDYACQILWGGCLNNFTLFMLVCRHERQNWRYFRCPVWKTKTILESFEYFCQISSKSIFVILSYTVSKLVHFLRHSVASNVRLTSDEDEVVSMLSGSEHVDIFMYVVALLSHEFHVRLFAAPTVKVLRRQRTNVQFVKRYRL